MIEIDIEVEAGIEPHKEVPVAKLHKEADLVKAQNTVQVIVIGNQEEVAHLKDVTQEEEAHSKEEEEAFLEDTVQEYVVLLKEAAQEDIAEVVPLKEVAQKDIAEE